MVTSLFTLNIIQNFKPTSVNLSPCLKHAKVSPRHALVWNLSTPRCWEAQWKWDLPKTTTFQKSTFSENQTEAMLFSMMVLILQWQDQTFGPLGGTSLWNTTHNRTKKASGAPSHYSQPQQAAPAPATMLHAKTQPAVKWQGAKKV